MRQAIGPVYHCQLPLNMWLLCVSKEQSRWKQCSPILRTCDPTSGSQPYQPGHLYIETRIRPLFLLSIPQKISIKMDCGIITSKTVLLLLSLIFWVSLLRLERRYCTSHFDYLGGSYGRKQGCHYFRNHPDNNLDFVFKWPMITYLAESLGS